MNQKTLPALSSSAKSVVIGSLYEHYKGNRYKIITVTRHSETLEEVVVYQALSSNNEVWVRPFELFIEEVFIHGHSQPRFKLIE